MCWGLEARRPLPKLPRVEPRPEGSHAYDMPRISRNRFGLTIDAGDSVILHLSYKTDLGPVMFIDIACSTCGEQSRIGTADEPHVSRCRRCGRSFDRDSNADERSRFDEMAIEDAVIAWLAHSPHEPATESADVDTCFACGFEGSMPHDSERGVTICPACWAVRRDVPEASQLVVDCPQCGQPIDVYERDRGKTTVCPHCKYFLGCVLLSDKRRFGQLRFLGFKLSQKPKATT